MTDFPTYRAQLDSDGSHKTQGSFLVKFAFDVTESRRRPPIHPTGNWRKRRRDARRRWNREGPRP